MGKKNRIPHKFHPWIEVRKRYSLSHAHIQMARELGLSPKRFGSYANCDKQSWKLPLPQFIEALYEKHYGKSRPDEVRTIEQLAADQLAKRAIRKAAKEAKAESATDGPESAHLPEEV